MSPSLSYPIQSIRIGGRAFEADYSFPRHVQTWHQLYAVLEGRVRVWVEGQTHLLRPGEALWMAPMLRREPRAASERGRYLNVTFHSPWPKLGGNRGQKIKLDRTALAQARLCADLIDAGAHEQAIAFHALCLHLLGPGAFKALKETTPPETPAKSGLWVVSQLERIMNANVDTLLGIEDMAILVRVSRATLVRLFRRHRRSSPAARFREIRLDHALRLLRAGGLSVTEIALQTGFSSSQHFATAFRHRFNKAPSSIRSEPILYINRAGFERHRR